MLKIVLLGNYGAGNYGDDLLLLGSFKLLLSEFRNQELELAILTADRYPVVIRDQIAKLTPTKWRVSYLPLVPTGLRSFLKIVFRWQFIKLGKVAKNADLVIFGGGGLFNTEVPRSLVIWGKQLRYFKKKKKPVLLLGQSFAGINQKLINLLASVDLISARERPSLQKIKRFLKKETILKQASDLLFAADLPTLFPAANAASNKYVCFNLRAYRQIDRQQLFGLVKEMLQEICDHTDYQIRFLPFDLDDRVQLTKLFESLAPELRNRCKLCWDGEELYDLERTITTIKNSQGCIGMRLHFLLVAMAFNRPVLALSYQNKVKSMLPEMAHCYDLRGPNLDLAELISKLQAFIKDTSRKSDALKYNIKEKQELALANIGYIKAFLDN